MNASIDDEWYSVESSTILKKIITKLESIDQSISNLSDRIKTIEQKLDILDIKKEEDRIHSKLISSYLQELHILKEREINALLREHIPFPFLLKSKEESPINSSSRFLKLAHAITKK